MRPNARETCYMAARVKRRTLIVSALLGVLVVAAVAGYGFLQGWFIERLAPRELSAMLRPADTLYKPEGDGPFPVVALFHGCGGIRESDHRWAELFRDQGFVAVVVDSLRPRDLQDDERWRAVCQGKTLWGRERAGDVLVTLADLRKLPYVDPKRIVLAGWSHGAWTIMDALALEAAGKLPTNLATDPGGLDGVKGAILFYPYCGLGSLSREGWSRPVPSLMLLAERDRVTAHEECIEAAEALRNQGQPVTVHVYPGVDHAFDYTDLPPDSNLPHDPVVTADAKARVTKFLDDLLHGTIDR